MGLYRTINDLKLVAINTKMVNMSSFGDIQEYNNKATIVYPYINLDVVTSNVNNYSIKYTIRVYVCDRNSDYIAYNKTETILNTFLKNNDVDINNYTINYFRNDFQDGVYGVWCDIVFEDKVETECNVYSLPESGDYILQENGDLIRIEIIPA